MTQWYETVCANFGRTYDKECFKQGTVGEVDFVEREPAGDRCKRILDIGCGTGRHANPPRPQEIWLCPPPRYHIPLPQRARRIAGSSGWIDHRLLRNGFLAVMTHPEQSLYLFLALAADHHGVSFYRQEKIADLLGLDDQAFAVARDRLIELGLSLKFHRTWNLRSPCRDRPGMLRHRASATRAVIWLWW
jgi:hypothetical protein